MFDSMRPVVANGIVNVVRRHDLADRAIILDLAAIPEEKRLPEKDLWENFDDDAPGILGALLDAVSASLRHAPTLRMDSYPRMADFAEWVVAAEPSLPWEEGRFLKEYAVNREYLVEVGLESDEVGSAMLQFMHRRNKWSGTPTELLRELNRNVSKNIQQKNYWPKRPNTLSSRLVPSRQQFPIARRDHQAALVIEIMLELTQEHLCYNSFLTGQRRRDRRPSHFLPLLTTIIQLWWEKSSSCV